MRHWTLNENLNYCVCTGLSEPQVRLELSLKRLSGAVEVVGTYDLNLVALSQRGPGLSRGLAALAREVERDARRLLVDVVQARDEQRA